MSTHALQNYTQCFIFRMVFSKSGGVHGNCSKGEGGRGRGERGEVRGEEPGALTIDTGITNHSFIPCLQRRSSIAQLDPPFPQFRLCSVSP